MVNSLHKSGMGQFVHDQIHFYFRDEGSGLPFFFQHGLGADVSQPFSLFRPSPAVRLIAFDARAHGQDPSDWFSGKARPSHVCRR